MGSTYRNLITIQVRLWLPLQRFLRNCQSVFFIDISSTNSYSYRTRTVENKSKIHLFP